MRPLHCILVVALTHAIAIPVAADDLLDNGSFEDGDLSGWQTLQLGSGRWLASGSSDGTIRVWDLDDDETPLRLVLDDHSETVLDVAFDPAGF